MEVNDRLKQSGGDGKNTTRAQEMMIVHSQWLIFGALFWLSYMILMQMLMKCFFYKCHKCLSNT